MLKLSLRNSARVKTRGEVGDGSVGDGVGGEGENKEEPEVGKDRRARVVLARRHAGLS